MTAITFSGVPLVIPTDPDRILFGNIRNLQKFSNSPARCKLQQTKTQEQALPISSSNSENDLAAIVRDFIENGSNGSTHDGYDSSEEPPRKAGFAVLYDNLKALVGASSPAEKQLRGLIARTLNSMSEEDLDCMGIDCRGGCIRRFLVKKLRMAGFDAGICTSSWQTVGKIPGGEYEYIDVEIHGEERMTVDLDFESSFQIARPIQQYDAVMKLVPTLFIGSSNKLKKVLEVMFEAMRYSLKKRNMHLPPWRTLEYLLAKWLSPYERQIDKLNYGALDKNEACVEQLRSIKACLPDKKSLPVMKSRHR